VRPATRSRLGPLWSEGARLLWGVYEQRYDSFSEMADDIGCPRASLHRWMYGERRPGLRWAVKIQGLYKIRPAQFFAAATAAFAPPHAEGAVAVTAGS
jgi:hypothetical protein